MAKKEDKRDYSTLRMVPVPIDWTAYITAIPLAATHVPGTCVHCGNRVFVSNKGAMGLDRNHVQFSVECHYLYYGLHASQAPNPACMLPQHRAINLTGRAYEMPWPGARTDFTGWLPGHATPAASTGWLTLRGAKIDTSKGESLIIAEVAELKSLTTSVWSQFHVANLFMAAGYAVPLALCFPETLPLDVPEDDTSMSDRDIRKTLRAMQASITYSKAAHRVMLAHLSNMVSLPRPVPLEQLSQSLP